MALQHASYELIFTFLQLVRIKINACMAYGFQGYSIVWAFRTIPTLDLGLGHSHWSSTLHIMYIQSILYVLHYRKGCHP